MKCKIKYLEGRTLVTTIISMVSVLKISVSEAKEMYNHIKNKTEEIWLDIKDVEALEKKFINVHYDTEKYLNKIKEEERAEEEKRSRIAEAENWYNSLSGLEQNYVNTLIRARGWHPPMG